MDIPLESVPTSSTYELYEKYLKSGLPFLLSEYWTKDWKLRQQWVDENGCPNYDNIRKLFGSANVPVLKQANYQTYDSVIYETMKLDEFLQLVQSSQGNELIYLKDWHFVRDFPEYGGYTVPNIFKSDWMNEYWDHKNDPNQGDYRFLYFGIKDTWTPFHADVLRSFSWSANICGTKLWYVVPPGNESYFCKSGSQPQFDTFIADIRERSEIFKEAGVLEITQLPGQIIFVPSGWHHQVHNLTTVISVNHNWFNACSIHLTHEYLLKKLTQVQKEISDCKESLGKDYENQCELILAADVGVNLKEFRHIIQYILHRRKELLNDISHVNVNITCCCTVDFVCNVCQRNIWMHDVHVCTELMHKLRQ